MSEISNIDGTNFHDHLLVDAYSGDGEVKLKIEYYGHFEKPFDSGLEGVLSWSIVWITRVVRMERDGALLARFVMEGEYASILDIAWTNADLEMIVEWRGSAAENGGLRMYRFRGPALTLTVVPCGEDTVLSMVGES